MSDSTRRRRTSRTGALAQILAEEQTDKKGQEDQSTVEDITASRPMQSPNRYYPTKGRAKVPPQVCRPWKYADRPEAEAVHATEIAESFAEDGQIAAAIVRCVRDPEQPEIRYEIISGQVRWRAALAAGADLEVDIRDLEDKAAFRLMVRENELRRNLSDYAKALRLHRVLMDGIYADRTSLARDMGLSPAQLSYYLGFAELPPRVVNEFKDITKISVRLGYVINRAVEQGFLDQIIDNLAEIESGVISRDQIPAIWTNTERKEGKQENVEAREASRTVRFRREDGMPLFSVRQDKESGPVLRFSKAVAQVLDEDFWDEIRLQVEERLKHAQHFSTEK